MKKKTNSRFSLSTAVLGFIFVLLFCSQKAPAQNSIRVNQGNVREKLQALEPGSTVQFDPGEYSIEPIIIPSGTQFSAVSGEAILYPANQLTTQPLFLVQDTSEDIEFYNISFSSDGSHTQPLFKIKNSGLEFINCRIRSFKGSPAIEADNSNIRLARSIFTDTPQVLDIKEAGSNHRFQAIDCEFSAPPVERVAFIEANGPLTIGIESDFSGGGSALRTTGVTSLHIRNSSFNGSAGTCILARYPESSVLLRDVRFEGSFGGAGVHVIGMPEQDVQPHVVLQDIIANNVAVKSPALGFVTIVGPVSFESIRLTNLDLKGKQGTAVKLVARSDSILRPSVQVNAQIEGWQTGLAVDSTGVTPLIVSIDHKDGASDFSRNETAIHFLGISAQLLVTSDSLSLTNNRDGIVLDRGATAALAGTEIINSSAHGILVGDNSKLALRYSTLSNNGIGVLISKNAGNVILGTKEESGENLFQVQGIHQWAVKSLSEKNVSAIGNRWIQDDLEVYSQRAIDDLVDDGDEENPVVETGTGEVIVYPVERLGRETIRWDKTASRSTAGYGNYIFRSQEEVMRRVDQASALEFGPGQYTLPDIDKPRFTFRGAGVGETFVTPSYANSAIINSDARAMTLEKMTLVPNPGRPAIRWSTGALTLRNVHIPDADENIVITSREGGPIVFDNVLITAADTVSTHSEPLLSLKGRPVRLNGLILEPSAHMTAMHYDALNQNVMLNGSGLTINGSDVPTSNGIVIRGETELDKVNISGAYDTGILFREMREPYNIILDDLRMTGFRRRAIGFSPGDYSMEISNAHMEAVDDSAFVASGISLGENNSVGLTINGLFARRLRPALLLQGEMRKAEINGLNLELGNAFNDIFENEDGISINLRSPAEETPDRLLTIRGSHIAGYDNGIHFASSHDDPATFTLGHIFPTFSNEIIRNSVGVRSSSPNAFIYVNEHRWASKYRDNGVAFLIEDGSLRMDNTRVLNNQAAIIVRGGTVDLGGGPYGSVGMNRFWPQAGALAIINETASPVYALKNDWGEASVLIGSSNSPIRDRTQNPDAGPVITEYTDSEPIAPAYEAVDQPPAEPAQPQRPVEEWLDMD